MSAQLGFDALLAQADASNKERHETHAYAHLPDTIDKALPFFRDLVDKHHAAMLDGNAARVERLRKEAHDLAYKLNNFEPGIIADESAPGCMLDRLTRAPEGQPPLWGQSGSFIIAINQMRVRIHMDGVFGICASSMAWMGFGAHAVDFDRPFLSETGFRSFLGVGGALFPGYTPSTFAAAIVSAHVDKTLKGKLRPIDHRYRHADQ